MYQSIPTEISCSLVLKMQSEQSILGKNGVDNSNGKGQVSTNSHLYRRVPLTVIERMQNCLTWTDDKLRVLVWTCIVVAKMIHSLSP